MNVSQLREMLQDLETEGYGETEVKFAYNYGDHWRTQVAADVDGCAAQYVMHSAYHSMDKVVDQDDVEEEDEDGNFAPNPNAREVIVLT
jgi:hypothetical protein